MGKLVRDRIPEIIRMSGRVPEIRKLDADAYQSALHDRLAEEAEELRDAESPQDTLEEAADVLEVLAALAACHGYTLDDVRRKAEEKRHERGGFMDRIWLE